MASYGYNNRSLASNTYSSSNIAPNHRGRGNFEAQPSPFLVERSETPTLFNHSEQLTKKKGTLLDYRVKSQIVEELEKRGYGKQAQRFAKCGQVLASNKLSNPALMCNGCGHLHTIVEHCTLRICPECSINKVNRYKSLYLPILSKYYSKRSFLTLRFMTLTVKNVEKLSGEIQDNLRKALRRFRRYKEVKKYMYKGLASFEVTEKGKGWHPHIHIIYYGKYFPNKPDSNPKKDRLLTQLWAKACKGLFKTEITDVRPIKDLKSALNEVLKYIGKGSVVQDPIKAVDFLEIMKGRRLCSMWGFKEKIGRMPKLACPECGGISWTFLSECEAKETSFIDYGKLTAYYNSGEAYS